MENRILATFKRNILLSFMILLTLTSVISLQMKEAYAVTPTITATTGATAGDSTATTTIVVVFQVGVNGSDAGADGDTVNAWSVAGNTVTSVSPLLFNDPGCNGGAGGDLTLTITLGTAIATDAVPQVTYDGDQAGAQNITIRACTGGEPLVNASSSIITPADGLSPVFASAATASATTIDVVFTETVTAGTVAITDFTLGGTIASGASLTGTPSVSGSTVTLSLDGGMVNQDSPTIAYVGSSAKLNDANTNFAQTFTTQSVTNNIAPPPQGSGCRGDCSAPTLGVDKQFTRVVENGFTYNGNTINVERYFTPYPLITVDVGKQNKAVFKIYDDLGPDNIRHFDFAFGLDIGQTMGTSNAMIVWEKSTDGTETVTLVDPHNALDKVRVLTSEGKCKADSTTNDCLIVTVFHTFRESLDFDMVGTNVWDFRQNAWQNFYNHGIHIEGQSLNPPDEYVGIYKGNLIHLIETGKNTAVDTDGNTWTFDNTWIKDYIHKGKIDDPITSQGYDRNHVRFDTYKQGQELVANSLFEKYYKTSISQEPAFSEIDDIKLYEFSETIGKRFDLLQAKMHEEDIRAQKYLEEMFAKMYPSLDSAEIDDIKFYEYPDTIDKRFDPVLQAKMHQEDIRAQKYLEEMFAKMYPGIIYD